MINIYIATAILKRCNTTASFKAAKHNKKQFYLCSDILNISYQEKRLFPNTAKSLFPLWSKETCKAALWSQDVCPLFEVYLTTICICFPQQSK